jgi:hypothetical protein
VLKAVLVPLLALATAASASAAAQESLYRIQPTRWCLIGHGAHHLTTAKEPFAKYKFGFGQPYAALTWNASGRLDSITRVPTDWIGIEFAPSPARGRASEQQVRHILHAAYGFGAGWIRRHLMRRANVVIAAYSINRPLTAGQRALIVGCLRR